MGKRRIPTAIQILNCALSRATLDETPNRKVEPVKQEMIGSGSKEVKPTTSIKIPKEKKAELISTRVLLTR